MDPTSLRVMVDVAVAGFAVQADLTASAARRLLNSVRCLVRPREWPARTVTTAASPYDTSVADRLSKAERSALMSRIRSKDTGIELSLRTALHISGLRYRLHRKDLPGTPDIVFPRARVAVFVDGCFWHGFDYGAWSKDLTPPWRQKIEANMARDRRNNALLSTAGWYVMRVWQHDVQRDLPRVVSEISWAVSERSQAHCVSPRSGGTR